jgi:hypothetical protein
MVFFKKSINISRAFHKHEYYTALDTVSKGFTREAEYGRIKVEGSHERKQ